MSTADNLKHLGNVSPAAIQAKDLETVRAPNVSGVVITGAELSAVCPVTEQPDIYQLRISYSPQDVILESKALKLYLNGWRDKGIMAEHLAAEIAQDLANAVGTGVTVTLTQQPRGGLSIEATAEGNPA